MKIVNLYSGSDGESHFRDIELHMEQEGSKPYFRTKVIKPTEFFFRYYPDEPDKIYNKTTPGWHNAPAKQYFIVLEGELEIEVGDGSRRRLGPGQILLAEDTTGRGHVVHGNTKHCVIIRFD